MASSSHPWEAENYSFGTPSATDMHPWEEKGYNASPDEDNDSDKELTAEEEGCNGFVEYLADLYFGGARVTANHLCILCHYARMAGVKDKRVAAYALRPGVASGNYQKHLDRAMGLGAAMENCMSYKSPEPQGTALGEVSSTCP